MVHLVCRPDGQNQHDPSARPQTGHFLTFCRIWGRRTGPKGLEMAVEYIWVDSQVLATILDSFQAILADFGVCAGAPSTHAGARMTEDHE